MNARLVLIQENKNICPQNQCSQLIHSSQKVDIMAEVVAQVVEYLPSKHEVPSSKLQYCQKKKKVETFNVHQHVMYKQIGTMK
jgi:hypothetical protein